MAPRKELSVDQREMIVNISKQGKSIRSIGILLNISKSSVFATLRRMKETGSVANKPGRGCNSILTAADHRYIKLISLRDPSKTVPEITKQFNTERKSVSLTTIRKSLKNSRVQDKAAAIKPALSKKDKVAVKKTALRKTKDGEIKQQQTTENILTAVQLYPNS